ncbi:hypothetical protein UAB78_027 [Escherichia phage UAB_Phi78]|uniref:Uncharacterized protein n=1 Tax=Escherichia phage UAB_Phi78 TaxID=979726 RepID=A0A9K0IFM8_9CAUD|nr:DNA repair protein [Escherichia phage UAB_Phi78]ADW95231.1 hypothetical protein UAB78_027 [Escherichia phage UAB_Phi78]
MPSIESRLKADYESYYDHLTMTSYLNVYIKLDGSLFHLKKYTQKELFELGYWIWSYEEIAEKVLLEVLKEWPTCQDQTSSSELQCRKTVVSSCGRLKVRESLS